jgi:hypothetical protein
VVPLIVFLSNDYFTIGTIYKMGTIIYWTDFKPTSHYTRNLYIYIY